MNTIITFYDLERKSKKIRKKIERNKERACSIPGSYTVIFLLYPYMVEGAREFSGPLL